jgi:hypothetical protein
LRTIHEIAASTTTARQAAKTPSPEAFLVARALLLVMQGYHGPQEQDDLQKPPPQGRPRPDSIFDGDGAATTDDAGASISRFSSAGIFD